MNVIFHMKPGAPWWDMEVKTAFLYMHLVAQNVRPLPLLPRDLNRPAGYFTVIEVDTWLDEDDAPAAAEPEGRLTRLHRGLREVTLRLRRKLLPWRCLEHSEEDEKQVHQ